MSDDDKGPLATLRGNAERDERFDAPVPGPWRLVMDMTDGPEFWPYARIKAGDPMRNDNYFEMSGIVNGHDARMMAAAPEMVQALIEAEEALEAYEDVRDGPEGQQLPNAAMRALQEVRAALDKALGPSIPPSETKAGLTPVFGVREAE